MCVQRFRVRIAAGLRGSGLIVVPFDPDAEWGVKAVHHVSGTVNGCQVRVTLEPGESAWAFTMNPARMQQAGIATGSQVPVELSPEGRSAVILPMTSRPRLRVTLRPARSSTRSRSSTAMAICVISTPPSGGRTCARRGSPR
jgi:hypothetical protein